MTETGTIREIRENLVIVAPEKSAACFGCINHECKTAGGFITAENPEALPLKNGQTVEVKAPGINILTQALAALLPPIMGFIAGYTITRLLFQKAGESAAAFFGAIFLFITAFVVYWIRKKYPANRAYKVTRILKS